MPKEKDPLDLRRFRPALDRRTVQFSAREEGSLLLLIVEGGNVSMTSGGIPHGCTAPSLAILPPTTSTTLVIEAGAAVSVVEFGIAHALGGAGLLEGLSDLSDGAIREFPLQRPDMLRFGGLLANLAREMELEGRHTQTARNAYISLIQIEISRLTAHSDDGLLDEAGPTRLLPRFRRLVERDFRRNRAISDYAEELGITTDRLHDHCRRATGRTPLQLVHQRLTREAVLQLERSARTVQQIAEALGFRDPTYFTHFFKRQTGLPPTAYRRRVRAQAQEGSNSRATSYADWP